MHSRSLPPRGHILVVLEDGVLTIAVDPTGWGQLATWLSVHHWSAAILEAEIWGRVAVDPPAEVAWRAAMLEAVETV